MIKFKFREIFHFGSYNQLNSLNLAPFFTFPCSKACKKPSLSSTFVMLSSILDDKKGEKCRKSSVMQRVVKKCKRKGLFKVNKEGRHEVEG